MAGYIPLVQGDTGPQVAFYLTDEITDQPVNLTDAAAVMRLRASGSTTVLITRPAVIPSTSATQGLLIIKWIPGDLDLLPGIYEGEVEVTFPDGMIQTVYDIQKFQLRADFA